MWNLPLLPPTASTLARHDNALMLYVVGVSAFFTGLISACILYFSVRYHHTLQADRSDPPEFHAALEAVWIAVPLSLLLSFFAWGTRLYLRHYRPPADPLTIQVVAKQWLWKLQHPGGQREINELHVPLGQPVFLHMISQDVIHSFFVPAFRLKQDVLPGRYSSAWFQATALGTFHLFCAQYCGTLHSHMVGRVVVLTPAGYQRWLKDAGAGAATLVATGQEIFSAMGCVGCHGAKTHRAPPLVGLYGSHVRLADGRSALADDDYIRESILEPSAKIVAGYPDIMPTFKGELNEEALQELLAYIQSLRSRRVSAATREREMNLPKAP